MDHVLQLLFVHNYVTIHKNPWVEFDLICFDKKRNDFPYLLSFVLHLCAYIHHTLEILAPRTFTQMKILH